MARRTRFVEKAYRRQKIVDRIVIGVIVLASAAGVMSVLPGTTQTAVRHLTCRIGSLGLGACGERVWTASATPLGEPRCTPLARLDQTLPEVSATSFTLPGGLRGRLLRSRAGDITVDFGDPLTDPPRVLDGDRRGVRRLMPGVEVPADAEWWQAGGQGADSVLQAIVDQHRRYRQQRSALALFAGLDSRGSGGVPAPTVSYSGTALDRGTLPGPAAEPATPKAARWVRIDPSAPAVVAYNRVLQQTSLIARLTGEISGRPVRGTVRITRDAGGRLDQVLLAVSTDQALLPGQTPPAGTASTAYIVVPVNTSGERALAEQWLSSPSGFALDLSPLLGWTAPSVHDQRAAWLSRAATVTVLTVADRRPDQLAEQAQRELTTLRRDQQTSALRAVDVVAPQPDGSRRQPVKDEQCVGG